MFITHLLSFWFEILLLTHRHVSNLSLWIWEFMHVMFTDGEADGKDISLHDMLVLELKDGWIN